MKFPIRSMVRAKPGYYLFAFDLSQAEAWIVAYLANEPTMKLELQFGDIHTRTARAVLEIPARPLKEEERFTGKKCNHAFNYLMKEKRAAEVINKEGQITVTIKQTKRYREIYLRTYLIQPWWTDVEIQLRSKHELVTPYGFRRRFYGSGEEGLKEAIAFIPQSTVADHCYGRVQKSDVGRAGGLKEIVRRLIKDGSRGISLVHSAHDSGTLEIPDQVDYKEIHGTVKECMVRPLEINGEEFTIPMDAKIGQRWEEFEKIKEAT